MHVDLIYGNTLGHLSGADGIGAGYWVLCTACVRYLASGKANIVDGHVILIICHSQRTVRVLSNLIKL